MKRPLYVLTCCLWGACNLFADDTMTPMQPSGSVDQPEVQSPVDCSNLDEKEHLFAAQMTDWNNRSIFCAKLTAEQRCAVMDLASKPNASGVLMTPDQALLQYMEQNQMTPVGTPQQPSPKRRPSGCGGS